MMFLLTNKKVLTFRSNTTSLTKIKILLNWYKERGRKKSLSIFGTMLSRPFCMVADPNLNDGFRDSFSLIVVIIMSGIQQKRAWQKHYICSGLYLCLCFYSVFTKRKQNRLIEKYFFWCALPTKGNLRQCFIFPASHTFGSLFETRTTTFVSENKWKRFWWFT